MNGGSITGVAANGDGGGIYNELYGILNMNGGSINGNIAYGSGGGIFKYTGSTLGFLDQLGNPTNDPAAIDSIMYNNYFQTDTGIPCNIEP